MAPPRRGLAAFSEIAPLKCVSRTPAVSVSQVNALYWSSRNRASRWPVAIWSCAREQAGAVVGNQVDRFIVVLAEAIDPRLALCFALRR